MQLALSQTTQPETTVFESASSASNPAFQPDDDVDQMELRVRPNDNDSDSEVIIFQRTATSTV